MNIRSRFCTVVSNGSDKDYMEAAERNSQPVHPVASHQFHSNPRRGEHVDKLFSFHRLLLCRHRRIIASSDFGSRTDLPPQAKVPAHGLVASIKSRFINDSLQSVSTGTGRECSRS